MRVHKATKRETMHIGVGTLTFSIIMNLVFFLIGKWDLTVLWGTLLGGGFAVLNFFLLGLAVQKMAAAPTPTKGQLAMQHSYMLRTLAMAVIVIAAIKLPFICWPATVIPLIFPQVTIIAMQFLGMYKPPKNEEGGDEPA